MDNALFWNPSCEQHYSLPDVKKPIVRTMQHKANLLFNGRERGSQGAMGPLGIRKQGTSSEALGISSGAKRSQREPGGARESQEEPGDARGARRSQGETGGARGSQEKAGARKSQERPGVARRSQEVPDSPLFSSAPPGCSWLPGIPRGFGLLSFVSLKVDPTREPGVARGNQG